MGKLGLRWEGVFSPIHIEMGSQEINKRAGPPTIPTLVAIPAKRLLGVLTPLPHDVHRSPAVAHVHESLESSASSHAIVTFNIYPNRTSHSLLHKPIPRRHSPSITTLTTEQKLAIATMSFPIMFTLAPSNRHEIILLDTSSKLTLKALNKQITSTIASSPNCAECKFIPSPSPPSPPSSLHCARFAH
jgi:hypothetical protein